jgi:hypothetical protein
MHAIRLQNPIQISCSKQKCIPTSSGSAVGTATRYGLDDWGIGVQVSLGPSILTSQYRPNRLWGPHILLSNGYRVSFPGDKDFGVKMTTRLQQLPKSR